MPIPPVHVVYPLSFWGNGPRRTCFDICRHWPAQGLRTRVHTAACLHADPDGVMAPALPMWLPLALRKRLAGRSGIEAGLRGRSRKRVLSSVRSGDLCYLWPGVPLELQDELRDRGARIVLEFINCHCAYAKEILDAECDRVGAPRYTHLDADSLDYDTARVAGADAVFAPGPMVEPSIRESCKTVPTILPAAYGTYLPRTVPMREASAARPLRFLYVGLLSLRKGLHVLLEAWKRAGEPGELWIAGGGAEPWITETWLSSIPASVKLLGHVSDIDAIYAQADVFVFPSLEEGGPQVTYEAAARGLPLVVTPMGGGHIARDGETALVIPPADADALAGALSRMQEDPGTRERMGRQAREAAPEYSWQEVALRRRDALAEFAAA